MTLLLTLLMLYTPHRIEAAAHISGAAWGFEPAMLMGLAEVESTLQHNPPRYGPKGKRWGPGPRGRKWNYCGLMQLRSGGRPMGTKPPIVFPPCEILILFPELSMWFASMHLHGWRRSVGPRKAYDAYNSGGGCGDGSFGRKVRRKARKWR